MFGDLPDGCVAHVVGLLSSLQDVLHFTATCKRHADIARALRTKWLQLAHKDFDTQLQVDGAAPFDGQEFYKSLAASKPCTLRFHGCFTDGGVDEQAEMYWVDNMFTPNHWGNYCSEYGSNVNCVGLLLGEGDALDKKWFALRSYIIQRCSAPVSQLFHNANPPQVPLGEPIPMHLTGFSEGLQRYLKLAAWSTHGLIALFLHIFGELQQGTQMGNLMLHGLDTPADLSRLRGLGIYLQQTYLQKLTALNGGQGAEHILLGSHCVKLMQQAAHLPQLVGVVESVSICRAGEFSCPLRCGVLFMANCNHLQWATMEDSSIMQACQASVAQQVCRELDDVDTPQALHDKIKEGRLPTAVAAHLTPQGGWVEFHPSYPQSDPRDPSNPTTAVAIPMLRPLAWFRLTTAAETELLRQREPNSEQLPQSDDAPWWQDLAEPGMPEHWRGRQCLDEPLMMESFVGLPPDKSELGDPASAASRLNIRLHHRHSGNMLCVKLIDQENLMAERHDDHPNPNIDVNFIACHGRLLELPEQVHVDWALGSAAASL